MNNKNFKCDCCGSQSSFRWRCVKGLDQKNYDLYCCDHCSVVSVFPIPDQNYLDNYYSNGHYNALKEQGISLTRKFNANKAAIEDFHACYDIICRLSQKKSFSTALDIGCGYGFSLMALKEKGIKAVGLDLDKKAINYAKEILNLQVIYGSIYDKTINFDSLELISAWEIIEHLYSPYKALQRVNQWLMPGGWFTGSVPNISGITARLRQTKWHLLRPPEHLFYFNKKSLSMLLKRVGFEPVFVDTIPLFAAPNFSFGIRKNLADMATRLDNKVTISLLNKTHRVLTLIKRHAIYRLLNFIIMTFNLGGDNLLFLARKKPLVLPA